MVAISQTSAAGTTPGGLLVGLRVVEVGEQVASAYCGKLLADLGADVVKIEPPTGDAARRAGPFLGDVPHPERSAPFLYLNTNKLGVTLDLRSATGRGLLDRLLEEADLLVESYPPVQAAAVGLDYATLHASHPRLYVVSITPFGQTGPYRDYRGTDITAQALGGLSIGVGRPDGEPLKLPGQQSGYQAGLIGAIGALGAMFGHDADREDGGQQLDVSEAEVWATIHTGTGVISYIFSQRIRGRYGHRLKGSPYPHTVLPCKDGYVALQCAERRQWKRFLEMMGNPAWGSDPKYRDRLKNNDEYAEELDALLAPWLMSHTKEEIFALCREWKISGSPVYTIDEVVQSQHLRERGFFVEIEHPEVGRQTYPGSPYQFAGKPPRQSRPAPLLGEHNLAIFGERLGISEAELVAMRQSGEI